MTDTKEIAEVTGLLTDLKASYAQRDEANAQITTRTALLRSALMRTAVAIIQRDKIRETAISNRAMGYSGWVLRYDPPKDPNQPAYKYLGRMFLLGSRLDGFYLVRRDDNYRGDPSPLGNDDIIKFPMNTMEQLENIWGYLQPCVAAPAPV